MVSTVPLEIKVVNKCWADWNKTGEIYPEICHLPFALALCNKILSLNPRQTKVLFPCSPSMSGWDFYKYSDLIPQPNIYMLRLIRDSTFPLSVCVPCDGMSTSLRVFGHWQHYRPACLRNYYKMNVVKSCSNFQSSKTFDYSCVFFSFYA